MDKLSVFFQAESIAVVGASRDANKVGGAILRNLMTIGYRGNIIPINPSADKISGLRCYPSLTKVPEKIDVAVIAVPPEIVHKALDDCGKKKIKHAVIITAGFKEAGNEKLEKQLEQHLKKLKINCIGPNCLGIFDAHTRIDTLFLPSNRLKRPKQGNISFITQSGASGSAILDLAAYEGFGFAKFVSYGNAANIDEADLLEFLENDEQTKIICMYIEGVKEGKKFLETAKRVSKKKPIIALKGGITEQGSKAVSSHTGSLAGNAAVYEGIFKQAGTIQTETLGEMFQCLKLFEKTSILPKGNRVQVITNGGGYGILAADSVVQNGLKLEQPTTKAQKEILKQYPRVIARNPTDLLGDATAEIYETAVKAYLEDKNSDILLVVGLPQTPLLDVNKLINILAEAQAQNKKPIIAVATGSEYAKQMQKKLEEKQVPCYEFPEQAVRALKKMCWYVGQLNNRL